MLGVLILGLVCVGALLPVRGAIPVRRFVRVAEIVAAIPIVVPGIRVERIRVVVLVVAAVVEATEELIVMLPLDQ